MKYQGAAGFDVTSQKVINMADGSANSDAATWGQVQSFARGIVRYANVRVRATGNLTLTGTQTIDGVACIAGDRVLADSQTTTTQDGVYVVAAGAWARAVDFPVGLSTSGIAITPTEGTANGDKLFIETADPAVIGTNDLTFGAVGGGATYTAGNGLTLTGSSFAVTPNGTSIDVSSSGVKIATTAAGNGVLVSAGGVISNNIGAGLTNSSGVTIVDTGVVTRWYSNAATHASGTTVSLTHNLGKLSYAVSICIASTGEEILADIVKGTNSVTVTFGASQSANTILLSVFG